MSSASDLKVLAAGLMPDEIAFMVSTFVHNRRDGKSSRKGCSASMTIDDIEPRMIEAMVQSPSEILIDTSCLSLLRRDEVASRPQASRILDFFEDSDNESIGTIEPMSNDYRMLRIAPETVTNATSTEIGNENADANCLSTGSSEGDSEGKDTKLLGPLPANSNKSFKEVTDQNLRKTRTWGQSYRLLVEFHSQNGHSNMSILNTSEANFGDLVQWVKRQRYHKKLFDEGKPGPMTPSRIRLLDKVGFVWNNHDMVWEEKFNMLIAFKRSNHHCNVPRTYPDNPRLSSWVKRQRQCYHGGKMDQSRIERLEQAGFAWDFFQKKQALSFLQKGKIDVGDKVSF